MNDEALAELVAHQTAWDPLRERRVLARIEAELDRRAAAPRRRWPIVAAVAATTVAIAAAAVLWIGGSPDDTSEGPSVIATAFEPPVPSPSPTPAIPTLPAAAVALGDGSIATLHDGAKIEVLRQGDDEVRLAQPIGRVHYEVRRGLSRTFVVEAADVRVTVLGTAFWVTHEPDAVRVTVEHGRVRVDRVDGDDPTLTLAVAELGPGDELRVGAVGDDDDDAGPAIEIVDEPTAREPASKPRPKPPTTPRRSVEELLDVADAARARSDLAAAAAALREVVTQHSGDPRAYATGFQLAKVERSLGRHAAAARAFAAVARRSPSGALTEDARAEAAIAWFDAGEHEAARKAGADYLARHPGGAHAARIERMLARLP